MIAKLEWIKVMHNKTKANTEPPQTMGKGAQWPSGRVLDSRPMGRGFKTHRHHCVVSLSKNFNPSLVLVQPRKTHPFITERLLMGRNESIKKTMGSTSKIDQQQQNHCLRMDSSQSHRGLKYILLVQKSSP